MNIENFLRKMVISEIHNTLYNWVAKKFCRHESTTEFFRCYQDRYVIEDCQNCGKRLYIDL